MLVQENDVLVPEAVVGFSLCAFLLSFLLGIASFIVVFSVSMSLPGLLTLVCLYLLEIWLISVASGIYIFLINSVAVLPASWIAEFVFQLIVLFLWVVFVILFSKFIAKAIPRKE